jgi:diacylglycerol kinase family enzyme
MQVCIETESSNREVAAHMVIIANQPRFGRRFCVAPGADNRDGQLDVCLFADTKSKTNLVRNILKTVHGTHTKQPSVECFRACRIALHTEEETAFFGDGEIKLHARSYVIEVVPRAINIICP